MNERSKELIGYIDVNAKIRELAEQAGCKIDRLGYGEGNLEKFAVLIVRECARIAIAKQTENDIANIVSENPAKDFAYDLIEHFGVE